MSPETKREAQAKLAKYTMKIAYPDRWRDYTALEVQAGDLVGNVMRSRGLQYSEKLGTPRPAGRTLALGLHAADGQRVRTARPTTKSRSRRGFCNRHSSTSMPTTRSTTAPSGP